MLRVEYKRLPEILQMFPHFQYPTYGFPQLPRQQVQLWMRPHLGSILIVIWSGLTEIVSPTGLWIFHASLWLPSAEEHCTAAPQHWAACGEGHTETTAPPAGEIQEDSLSSNLFPCSSAESVLTESLKSVVLYLSAFLFCCFSLLFILLYKIQEQWL